MTIPRTVGWGIVLATMTALISGVSVFANGLIVKEFPDPVVLTGVRNAMVGGVLLAILLATGGGREIRALSRRPAGALFAIAVIGGSVPFILFFSGLAMASGPGAAFIHKTLFVWVSLLAVPFLGETLGLAQLAALGVLVVGTLLVGPTGAVGPGPAEALILAATMLWAVEVVVARRLLRRDDVSLRLAATARMALGAALIAGFLAVTGRLGAVATLTGAQWLLIAATGALLFGYVTTWYAALQRAPAALVASILVGGAVVTAGLAVVRLGTLPAPETTAGLLLVALGVTATVAVGQRRGRRPVLQEAVDR
jgi:drug/metabolite transporter (DMT)-like permease